MIPLLAVFLALSLMRGFRAVRPSRIPRITFRVGRPPAAP